MLKFNFEKLSKNCPKYNAIKDALINSETIKEHLYNPDKIVFSCFIKTCCKETDLSLTEIIMHFSKDENFKIDLAKVNEKINSLEYLKCLFPTCKREDCIFYNKIDNPFMLGYKETKITTNPNLYPIESFPPLLRNYIEQLSGAMVAPPQYIGTSLLALLSTLCSRFAYIQATPTWQIPLTGYYLIVGDVSTKKTPTISEVLSLINGHTAKEDRVFANDSTIEALEQLLSKHKSILLHADESGIMDTLGGYTKTNHASSSKLLSLYTW